MLPHRRRRRHRRSLNGCHQNIPGKDGKRGGKKQSPEKTRPVSDFLKIYLFIFLLCPQRIWKSPDGRAKDQTEENTKGVRSSMAVCKYLNVINIWF